MDLDRIKAASQAAPAVVDERPADPGSDLHVDGDYAAYYFSGNDDTTIASAKRNLIDHVLTAKDIGGVGGRVVIHLSSGLGDKGKRFKIATIKPYQGQRDSSRRPKNWEAMRAWLEADEVLPGTDFRVKTWADREADDGAAVASRYAWGQGKTPVILTRDKDWRMFPGLHVVWTTFDRVLVRPEHFRVIGPDGELYGPAFFWHQMLMGDAADNIPGLERQPAREPGKFKTCGESCAVDWLGGVRSNREAFVTVAGLYRAYYGASWPDRFVEQAALLWMRLDNAAYVGDFMRVIPDEPERKELEAALVRLEKRIR